MRQSDKKLRETFEEWYLANKYDKTLLSDDKALLWEAFLYSYELGYDEGYDEGYNSGECHAQDQHKFDAD